MDQTNVYLFVKELTDMHKDDSIKNVYNEDTSKNMNSTNSKIHTEKLNLKALKRNHSRKVKKNVESKVTKTKRVPRVIVDIEIIANELKPLEDPPITPWEKEMCSTRLPFSFFDTSCEELAQNLLGKILVRKLENGKILKGKIVETESYLGTIDKASHTYQKKITPRNLPMYMPPGTIYVYLTYGMYHCFNISSNGEGCAVLIRAMEPVEGINQMAEYRNLKPKSNELRKVIKNFKQHELCNGPSKLCMAMQLDKEHSKYSMCTWKSLWLENCRMQEEIKIIKCARIGINSAGPEWAIKPLRYYIFGNQSVSKRDKKAENM